MSKPENPSPARVLLAAFALLDPAEYRASGRDWTVALQYLSRLDQFAATVNYPVPMPDDLWTDATNFLIEHGVEIQLVTGHVSITFHPDLVQEVANDE